MNHWIKENIQALETLNERLDNEIGEFKNETEMDCLPGCGECCLFPEIEATVLEFLPLAYHIYKDGKAAEYLSRDFSPDAPCILFRKKRGAEDWGCTLYPYRGMICRLFGFSATLSKEGKPVLATCKHIKKAWPGYQKAMENASYIPILRNYYNDLRDINPRLGDSFYPINEAIKRALELVSFTLKYESESSE